MKSNEWLFLSDNSMCNIYFIATDHFNSVHSNIFYLVIESNFHKNF